MQKKSWNFISVSGSARSYGEGLCERPIFCYTPLQEMTLEYHEHLEQYAALGEKRGLGFVGAYI